MARARMRNHFVAATIGSDFEAPDIVMPAFTCDAARLYAALRDYALAQPRTKLQSESPDENHMSFVQRTAYCRSSYGRGDLGVNRRRVKRWIAALEENLAKET